MEKIRSRTEGAPVEQSAEVSDRTRPLTRELICFDLVTGGKRHAVLV